MAKSFKCGLMCYFCGIDSVADLTVISSNAQGTIYAIDKAGRDCQTGTCASTTLLKPGVPGYLENCFGEVQLICPNGKALSNVEIAVCTGTNPKTWRCAYKQNAPFTNGPVRNYVAFV